MPILVEDLSVWDISFRWAGYDPRKLYFRIPLEVENNFRNLMNAILSAELFCLTITLEKRHFEADEKDYSVYYWIDDIYACIGGVSLNRKMLRRAIIQRSDFMLWCERMNIPLPEFWFPTGWSLEYNLPEDDIHPGYWYYRKDWTTEDWRAWHQQKEEDADSEAIGSASESSEAEAPDIQESGSEFSTAEGAASKMRPNQEARIACQQIAMAIWRKEPDRTIASVVRDELIQEYGGAKHYVDDTVREWVKVVAPPHVRDRRGRPSKNGGKDN